MPDYFVDSNIRIIFATKKMKEKRDFKAITKQIKNEILDLGCGNIKLNKDEDNLWIDDYENYLSASVHVDAISIDLDNITLYEDDRKILTFDHVHSIDRQIQIYETIYQYRNQLHYYELDWSSYFKALRVENENEGPYLWRILTPDEARHLWFNGKSGDICQLYDDGTEGMIDNIERLEECIKSGCYIGIAAY